MQFTYLGLSLHICSVIYCYYLLSIACHILYAVLRHFHAQVVISCVLSSCSRLLNKLVSPLGVWLTSSPAGTPGMESAVNEHDETAPVQQLHFPQSCIFFLCDTKGSGIVFIFGRAIPFFSSFLHTWYYKYSTL